ncbi:MAG: substrate-binding domain-containing protein [Desulfuromonadaceae bacterium]|nr:substrate-binding domain-containing protein [Desulfuromonadaceae bacterium]MDD2856077.1 substrate-binding domain-containing protein [Desulfuromonadaceae bacterium]
MKRSIAVVVVMALVAATSVTVLAAESITLIGGSTSISTVINPIKEAFEKKVGITLNATAAGSKVALQKLDAGDADVATAGHTPEELFANIKKDNIKLKNTHESINVIKLAEPANYSIVINPANSVTKLSKEQLEGIFTGKISNWKDVGGNDAAILCIVSNLSPGSNSVFSKVFLGGKKIAIDTLDASNAADLRQNIATNPDSIGYLPSAMVDTTIKSVDTLPMQSSPIIMLTIGKPSPKVQKLADFILGEGKHYIK